MWCVVSCLVALTTRVDLAADASGDVELETKLAGFWRRTQVYVTFCLRQKYSLFWGTFSDSLVKTSKKIIVGNYKVQFVTISLRFMVSTRFHGEKGCETGLRAITMMSASAWLLLTTRLVCAAADCLVDQLLSRLMAGGTWHRGALDRVTLGTHGMTVAFTHVATAGPCLTGLMGEKPTVSHTAHVPCTCTHSSCARYPFWPVWDSHQVQHNLKFETEKVFGEENR